MATIDRQQRSTTRAQRAAWIALLLALIALRGPSLVQPAGGDQGLYNYAGQRIAAGDVMYRDVWDQKPPAIAYIYSLLGTVWRHESIVPAADLVVAAAIAALLVVLGRRRYSDSIGYGAAAMFLLFGDPYLQRMSGVYVRGQCEPFMALAVTVAVVLLASPSRTRGHLLAAGMALGMAFWLKYNAAAYALPLAAAAWAWRPAGSRAGRTFVDWAGIGLGFALLSGGILVYFAAQGALTDLRLATIDYNLRYSNETYDGWTGVFAYVVSFPIDRARVDMLWFLGGLGALLLLRRGRTNGAAVVAVAWLAAAILSIAINGSRSLPNYFVQAAPVLALAASAGLATLVGARTALRFAVVAVVLAGLWRVGSDTPRWGLRLAGLPGLVENLQYDARHASGGIDRATYLLRFRGQKHDALENEELARYIRDRTAPADPILVFGFSGGSVCWKSERVSASRFFWSRPVFIEFEASRPGYGSAGLLDDLRARPPALVALQKEEWRSRDFFMNTAALREWLETGYVIDRETPMFAVWRRKTVNRTF